MGSRLPSTGAEVELKDDDVSGQTGQLSRLDNIVLMTRVQGQPGSPPGHDRPPHGRSGSGLPERKSRGDGSVAHQLVDKEAEEK
ncbi:hypothetical protein VTN00DRAFT_7234 [Thermoascus crustaceus]|uniref:uncharacterized protein n=1 Tax=Thermoascus crustaceus TaxID=5088 RepID=UPI0037444A5D